MAQAITVKQRWEFLMAQAISTKGRCGYVMAQAITMKQRWEFLMAQAISTRDGCE